MSEEFAEKSKEELLLMLKKVRLLAWLSYADDRKIEHKDMTLREILIITRCIGNDYDGRS